MRPPVRLLALLGLAPFLLAAGCPVVTSVAEVTNQSAETCTVRLWVHDDPSANGTARDFPVPPFELAPEGERKVKLAGEYGEAVLQGEVTCGGDTQAIECGYLEQASYRAVVSIDGAAVVRCEMEIAMW